MDKEDIEIFIKAKRGEVMPNILLALALCATLALYILESMNPAHEYTKLLLTAAFGLGSFAFGASKWAFVSRQQLIKIIEKQINQDPQALEYMSSSKS